MSNDRILVLDSATGQKAALPAGADGNVPVVVGGVWTVGASTGGVSEDFAFFLSGG